jgi:membrane protease subunit (stomatin/prohibitin family)
MPKFAGARATAAVVGDAMGLGAGVALGQVMANQLSQGLQGGGAQSAAAAGAAAAAPVGVRAEDVMATLEKLGDLKAKGILTQEEFDAKKANF